MKKILLFVVAVLLLSCRAQEKQIEQPNVITISANQSTGIKGYEMRIKKIISDSRCPEGVTCIWAGEIQLLVSVSKDQKLVEEKALTISSKQLQENASWFSKYLAADQKDIKRITVMPYPKSGVSANPKTYYIQIGF